MAFDPLFKRQLEKRFSLSEIFAYKAGKDKRSTKEIDSSILNLPLTLTFSLLLFLIFLPLPALEIVALSHYFGAVWINQRQPSLVLCHSNISTPHHGEKEG